MNLILSDFGVATLIFLVITYFVSAQQFTLGAMSLPAMFVMTSFIYFYVMPVLAFPDGNAEFLGRYIYSLEWEHFAVGLYAVGGIAACYLGRQTLTMDPVQVRATDQPVNGTILLLLAVLTVLAVIALTAMGRINPVGRENVEWTESADSLRFVNLFLTMIVPLSTIYLVRSNFNVRSLVVLGVGCFFLLLSGFRYRLIFMAFSVTAAFLMVRRIKVRTAFVLGCTFLGLLGTNFLVSTRERGSGLDFSRIEGMTWTDILRSFGGEVGPLFAFSNVADYPIRELYYLDPWLVGFTRLVPTFIWKDKPTADYLYIPLEGFSANAKAAGVAIPQQVEILLQFGWIGLPILAFIYFRIATFILGRLGRLGREVRISAFALTPIFFGFYMQTRGYFFQTLSDGLFTFGPLALLAYGSRRPRLEQQQVRRSRRGRA